jgi:hypothetical protein
VKFISFDKWREINESTAFKFDSLARYADPTFGLSQGKIDSSNIAPGGLDANWGGAMPILGY